MRETLFQAIITKLQSLSVFKGSNGTIRVYDFPNAQPDGYPYVVVSSDSMDSEIHDNQRDMRAYIYTVQIVGEKFGETGGKKQKDALAAMRDIEDTVIAAFDADTNLGNANVIRVRPTDSQYGYGEGNSNVILTINFSAEITAQISYT